MTKLFSISKQVVLEAFKLVRRNKGSAGVDQKQINDFELNLKNELFIIWNRMSSGSYFPPAVRAVSIEKKQGGQRILGIPTVGDRVAQTAVKMYLESELEKHFHPCSFGYRPQKSAHDAISRARENCWKYHWTIDLDIKGFFDNLDHELVMKAVKFHTKEKWIHLLIERWLKAPLQISDGSILKRDKGTPQGGVISPLLANLFLHYAFDKWMDRNFQTVPFERYADDIIVHCKTEKQAQYLLERIRARLQECKLELHPSKTKIVRCFNPNKKSNDSIGQFNFLGFTFRPRKAINSKGEIFCNFLPAISNEASKKIRQEIRSWKIHLKSGSTIEQIAGEVNQVVRGWIQYYGAFYKTKLIGVLYQLEQSLNRWACRKYRSLRRKPTRAGRFLGRIAETRPNLFEHWKFGVRSYAE
jgi:RNA-directed DNA polymerase